jgi:uncharacterized membrane protein
MGFLLLGLVALFGIWCGLAPGRRLPAGALWAMSILTFILLLSIMFVSTRAVQSEAEAFAFGEALIYLMLVLAFAFPFTLISWWMKLRNPLEWDKSKS